MNGQQFVDLNTLPLKLQLGGFVAQMMYWGFYRTEWWRNYLHVHSFYETCYVYAGRGTFLIDDIEYDVTVGDIFVAPPTLAHEIISSSEAPLGIYYWAHTLTAESPLAASTSVDRLFDSFLQTKQYISQRTKNVQSTIDLLTDEIIHKLSGHAYSIQALVTKLLMDTARAVTEMTIDALNEDQLETLNPAAQTAQIILNYLHDNYSRPLSLRDVSAQVHLSERHANRLFKQHTGFSIASYVRIHRLKTASILLLDPACSIKEVALKCGFTDVHYFTTAFHQHFGVTPDKFRKQRGTHFLQTD